VRAAVLFYQFYLQPDRPECRELLTDKMPGSAHTDLIKKK
jgi:hypothetical protein